MTASHSFTTDAARFPLHAVEPEEPDHFDLRSIDFDALQAGWNSSEVQAAYAEKNAFFDGIRDRQMAAQWGCSIDELPWNARTPS